jgi:hypothetical protein
VKDLEGTQGKTDPSSRVQAVVDATFHPVKGAGHGGRAFGSEENTRLVEKFVDKHQKNGRGAPRWAGRARHAKIVDDATSSGVHILGDR